MNLSGRCFVLSGSFAETKGEIAVKIVQCGGRTRRSVGEVAEPLTLIVGDHDEHTARPTRKERDAAALLAQGRDITILYGQKAIDELLA